jgi:hypothetical protein
MKKLIVLSVVAVGLWALSETTSRGALDAENNALVNGLADLVEKGDAAAVKKTAAAIAKDKDPDDIMSCFKPRYVKIKGNNVIVGIGLGNKPGAITPDGIELKINAIVRDGITKELLDKERGALVRAGYVTQAVAHFAIHKPPEKDEGKKTKAVWKEWSQNMLTTAEEFTAAAKSGGAAELKKAANNLKNSCDGCHVIFK